MTEGHRAPPHWTAWALLTIAPLTWGGNFVVGRLMRDDITPLELSFARWSLALAVLAPFTARAVWRQRRVVAQSWRFLLTLGATGIGGFHFLVYLALQSTGAINAGLFLSLTPVIIVALSFALFGERISPRQGLGIAVSLAGAVVLVLRGDPGLLAALGFNAGDLWMIVATPLWAFYSAILRRAPAHIEGPVLVTVTIALGLAVLMPFVAWHAAVRGFSAMGPGTLAGVAYVALFASVLAYLCWNRGIAAVGANRGGLFMHLVPVFSALLGVAVLGERLQAYHLGGAALVVVGIWLTTARR